MAKVGSYLNNSAHAVNIPATNAYAVARSHNLTNLSGAGGSLGGAQRAYFLGTLYIKLSDLALLSGTPTLTVRLCRDANGNDTVVGDMTASISTAITAAGEGAVTYNIDFAYSHNGVTGVPADNLHCFWKLDAGTGNVRRIELVTVE